VGVEELSFVQQGDSLQILIGLHPYILAWRARRRSKLRFYSLQLRA
jgi:hypothetical protein